MQGLKKLFGKRHDGPTCPHCGAELYGDERHCTNCGRKVVWPSPGQMAPPQAAAGLTCPHCGAPVVAGDVFCGDCGRPLGQAAPQQRQQQRQKQPQQLKQKQQPKQQKKQPNQQQKQERNQQPKAANAQAAAKDGKSPNQANRRVHAKPAPGSTLEGVLVTVADLNVDDDPLVRSKLVRLSRDEARSGCVKEIQLDGDTYKVRIPAGARGSKQLQIDGLGYEDDESGRQGALLVSFHIV